MDPNQDKEASGYTFELADDEIDEPTVDDFMRELEEKEKDLHITAETTFIELAADFEPDEVPDFMRSELATDKKVAVKPAAPSTAGDSRVKQLEAEISALKAKISGLEDERSELYKNSQRRLKDFESFKARTERERGETFQRQLSNLATQMLPALDNLDRALQCAADMSDEKQTEFAQFFDGIVLVNQQVHEVLAGMGILPITAIGAGFDPHFHEAVAMDDESDQPANTITAELLRGFRIGDTVIRHSMVKVARGAAPEKKATPADGAEEAPETKSSAVEEPRPATDENFEIERNGEIMENGEDGE
jgi:molecular chaperone GrpE